MGMKVGTRVRLLCFDTITNLSDVRTAKGEHLKTYTGVIMEESMSFDLGTIFTVNFDGVTLHCLKHELEITPTIFELWEE